MSLLMLYLTIVRTKITDRVYWERLKVQAFLVTYSAGVAILVAKQGVLTALREGHLRSELEGAFVLNLF